MLKYRPWGHALSHTRVLNFYIVIYREMRKTYSSQKQLHQIGQYLAWNILGTRRFKFVKIKSLGSCMTHPRGLNFYIVIYKEMLKKCSSQELLHQIGQYLARSIPRTGRFN